jgi:hypothetical protein
MPRISFGPVQSIMKNDLNTCWIPAKFVSEEHKDKHVKTCQDLQERPETDLEFLLKKITGDEMLVYRYDRTKQQSPQWKSPSSPCPIKGRTNSLKYVVHAQ